VMLLMFGVGLHFSAADLMAVRRIAVPGAVAQIVIATLIGIGMTHFWGWSLGAGLVLGLSLSVASTVVLLKALQETNSVETPNGRIAVGWLIVEDLAMVLALVLLPAFAGLLGGQADAHAGEQTMSLPVALIFTLLKVGAFVALVMMFGPRLVPWLLRQVARTGSRELFTLCVLTIALGIAFGSAKLFGVSFALGAFFAGVVLSESDLSHKAAANVLPLQDAFAVLFFISVGMLFEPKILVEHPFLVLMVLLLIIVGKSIVALGIVLVMGYPWSTALTVSAALAQIGEFSFILGGLGLTYKLMPADGVSLILAGAILSISVNPFVFAGANWLIRVIQRNPKLNSRMEEARMGPLSKLQGDLDRVRHAMEQKAAAHRTLTPAELVERFPLFAGLNPEQRETLILHFHQTAANPGDRIIRKGDKADAVYFIASGEVEVAVTDKKIKLKSGSFFGELALLSGQPRTADVTALDYSKFLTLSTRDFRQLLKNYPDIREHISKMAAERGEMNKHLIEAAANAPDTTAAHAFKKS
jgi:CPA2 family monovalent cation:H+ antiporter-2